MKSFRKIEKTVGYARARTNRAIDECILKEAEVVLNNFSHNQILEKKPVKNLWRFIMESKVTRYSAAAIVALAFVLVLFNPFGGSKNGGVVLAEAINKVQQMNTVTHKEEFLFWEVNQEQSYLKADALKLDVIKYASEEYGIADDVFNEEKTLGYQVYLIKDIQQFILVDHTEKKYRELSMPGDWVNQITDILTPRGFLEYFTSGHYSEIKPAKFDNINVEGFETSDSNIVFPSG